MAGGAVKKSVTQPAESLGVAVMISGLLLVVCGFLLTSDRGMPLRLIGLGMLLVFLGYGLLPHEDGKGDRRS
jgi:type IV secretory pathway VirB3-like protein